MIASLRVYYLIRFYCCSRREGRVREKSRASFRDVAAAIAVVVRCSLVTYRKFRVRGDGIRGRRRALTDLFVLPAHSLACFFSPP